MLEPTEFVAEVVAEEATKSFVIEPAMHTEQQSANSWAEMAAQAQAMQPEPQLEMER